MLQRIIDILYRTPKSKLKIYSRFGGYLSYRKISKAHEGMKVFSKTLEPAFSHENGLPIYFLTGKKYIHQTLFCIASLDKVSKEKFHFHLIDDGSFDQNLTSQIKSQLPGVTVVPNQTLEENIKVKFPLQHFPNLLRKRAEYPHIKKLTDIHTINDTNAYKLVLDSDMLFWKEPTALIDWLKSPVKPIHMVDCEESYGYPTEFLEELTGRTVPKLVNVGAIGIESSTINWDKLEEWIEILETKYGKSYFLEQALSAMIISGNSSIALDTNEYIVNPSVQQGEDNSGILHHYVDLAKKYYYQEAWKKI